MNLSFISIFFSLSFAHYNIRIINVCWPLCRDCETTFAGLQTYTCVFMCRRYLAARTTKPRRICFSLDIDVDVSLSLQTPGLGHSNFSWMKSTRSIETRINIVFTHPGHDLRSVHFVQWHFVWCMEFIRLCLDVIWQAGNRVYFIISCSSLRVSAWALTLCLSSMVGVTLLLFLLHVSNACIQLGASKSHVYCVMRHCALAFTMIFSRFRRKSRK